jgi:hypothetical protein
MGNVFSRDVDIISVSIDVPCRGNGPNCCVFQIGKTDPCHAESPGFHENPADLGKKFALCPEVNKRPISCRNDRV